MMKPFLLLFLNQIRSEFPYIVLGKYLLFSQCTLGYFAHLHSKFAISAIMTKNLIKINLVVKIRRVYADFKCVDASDLRKGYKEKTVQILGIFAFAPFSRF